MRDEYIYEYEYWPSIMPVIIFSLAIAMIMVAVVLSSPSAIGCNAEDELLVTVTEDSFQYEEGDQLCVHIDTILR